MKLEEAMTDLVERLRNSCLEGGGCGECMSCLCLAEIERGRGIEKAAVKAKGVADRLVDASHYTVHDAHDDLTLIRGILITALSTGGGDAAE